MCGRIGEAQSRPVYAFPQNSRLLNNCLPDVWYSNEATFFFFFFSQWRKIGLGTFSDRNYLTDVFNTLSAN